MQQHKYDDGDNPCHADIEGLEFGLLARFPPPSSSPLAGQTDCHVPPMRSGRSEEAEPPMPAAPQILLPTPPQAPAQQSLPGWQVVHAGALLVVLVVPPHRWPRRIDAGLWLAAAQMGGGVGHKWDGAPSVAEAPSQQQRADPWIFATTSCGRGREVQRGDFNAVNSKDEANDARS